MILSSSRALFFSAATAAFLFLPSTQGAAAEGPYRIETHGPRIATRIALFFRDIANGQNPNDRYRQAGYPQPNPVRQAPYGYHPSGPRINLDHPPAMADDFPQDRQPQFTPELAAATRKQPAPRDSSYAYSEAPPPERDNHKSRIDSHQEDAPPVNSKPKSLFAQKPAVAPKPRVEEPPAKHAPEKTVATHENPAHATHNTISSTTASSMKKSWQSFGGDSSSNNAHNSTEPAVENKTPSTPMISNTAATPAGSKTSKEGRVKSPYAPFNELDVTGLAAGSLAMDPTTGKVFRVP